MICVMQRLFIYTFLKTYSMQYVFSGSICFIFWYHILLFVPLECIPIYLAELQTDLPSVGKNVHVGHNQEKAKKKSELGKKLN